MVQTLRPVLFYVAPPNLGGSLVTVSEDYVLAVHHNTRYHPREILVYTNAQFGYIFSATQLNRPSQILNCQLALDAETKCYQCVAQTQCMGRPYL